MKNRQWLLARRPHGAVQDSDFQFVETDVPTPGAGEVLYMPRVSEAIGALAGWVQGKIVARSTCSMAWRTRRQGCGGCSKVATRASSCCV